MDARETYRREKAAAEKRGAATTPKRRPAEAEKARAVFVERLGMLRRGRSWRVFGAEAGLSHSTMNGWTTNKNAQPNMADLRALAQRATLPGVRAGRLSVDWLCGLSDEPDRDARAEVGQLPGVLANHVAQEVLGRLPRTGLWKSFVYYWRTDGKAIIAQAIEREVECFRQASDGMDDLAREERAVIKERLDAADIPRWPVRGASHEKRMADYRQERRRREGLVAHLVLALQHAEFVRRVNASGAPLVYVPAGPPCSPAPR